jgi:outer membrane protein assembly factor BamA
VRRVLVCEGGKGVAASLVGGLVTVVLLLAPAQAAAQDTRAGEIAEKQEQKAATAQPHKPSAFERIMTDIEDSFLSPPSGLFPYFGSVFPGGGFTLGLGYRRFYAREAVWEVKGLYSIKNYKNIEVGTRTPWNFAGRWLSGVKLGWRDATQVGFYGLGPDSTAADRANARIKQTYLVGDLGFRPSKWTRLDGEVAYEDYKDEGGSGRAPSIETVYDSTTAPGLFQHVTYLRSQATAAIDWRVSPGYTRTGGFYGVTFTDHADTDKTYSFQRLDGEIIQHLPILRETWVLSFRGRVQSVVDGEDTVPYYLLPFLGSGSTLRAYTTGRFRDRNALLTTAEFRWVPSRLAMDVAIFYDAGKVAGRFKDLDFNNMSTNWGAGVRFHGPAATPIRFEMAKGTDGWHLVISSSAAF